MLRSLLIAEIFGCERLSHQGEHEPQNEQQVGPCIYIYIYLFICIYIYIYRPLLQAQEESLFNQQIIRGQISGVKVDSVQFAKLNKDKKKRMYETTWKLHHRQ